jgi:hypothetical protein
MRWAAHLSLEAMLSHVQAGEAVVLGLMSGSSLDGLDLCLARFGYGPTRPWSYQILKSRTIPYDEALQERLRRAPMAARQELLDLDVDLGRRWAHEINRLLQDTPPSGPTMPPASSPATDIPLITVRSGVIPIRSGIRPGCMP